MNSSLDLNYTAHKTYLCIFQDNSVTPYDSLDKQWDEMENALDEKSARYNVLSTEHGTSDRLVCYWPRDQNMDGVN